MKNRSCFFLPLSLLLTAPGAFAQEEAPSGPPAEAGEPPDEPASSSSMSPPPAAEPPPASAASSPEDAPAEAASRPASRDTRLPRAPEPDGALRPTLGVYAGTARLNRFGETALGLTAAGTLFGVGFAAEAPDMTWSHALWVASGVVALGSVANLFVPSDLEDLQNQSGQLSDAELERRWGELAQQAKVMRRTGAVVGGLLGAASITLGVLAFEGELGALTDDQRRALGSVLVAGGALGGTQGAVDWFLPTPVERGFAVASTRQRFALAGAPSPTGFHLSLTGAF